MDTVSRIIEYESGELDAAGTLNLFANLIKDGTAWQLQGAYGRVAKQLIEKGYVTVDGEITVDGMAVVQSS